MNSSDRIINRIGEKTLPYGHPIGTRHLKKSLPVLVQNRIIFPISTKNKPDFFLLKAARTVAGHI